ARQRSLTEAARTGSLMRQRRERSLQPHVGRGADRDARAEIAAREELHNRAERGDVVIAVTGADVRRLPGGVAIRVCHGDAGELGEIEAVHGAANASDDSGSRRTVALARAAGCEGA